MQILDNRTKLVSVFADKVGIVGPRGKGVSAHINSDWYFICMVPTKNYFAIAFVTIASLATFSYPSGSQTPRLLSLSSPPFHPLFYLNRSIEEEEEALPEHTHADPFLSLLHSWVAEDQVGEKLR